MDLVPNRLAPGSIPGERILFLEFCYLFFFKNTARPQTCPRTKTFPYLFFTNFYDLWSWCIAMRVGPYRLGDFLATGLGLSATMGF